MMKISLVQFSPEFGNIKSNSKKILDYCNNIESEIIVFPELAFSGYDFRNREEAFDLSFEFGKEYMIDLQNISTKNNKIICVGFSERIGDKLYNSAAVFLPKEELSFTYHKVHLFFKERFIFNESEKGFLVKYYEDYDINVGLMICYDWRFPEASRTLALKGADIILCPSNLVTNVWHISTPSRALENKVYLAIANRIGNENRNGTELLFNGGSVIHSYNGSDLIKASVHLEQTITAEISPEKTRDKSFNDFNNIFSDRRAGFYAK